MDAAAAGPTTATTAGTWALPAQATLRHVAALAQALPAALQSGSGAWKVDAHALTDFDSATLALLLQAQRGAAAAGRSFEVVGAPALLVQLAALYGLDGLLGLPASPPA